MANKASSLSSSKSGSHKNADKKAQKEEKKAQKKAAKQALREVLQRPLSPTPPPPAPTYDIVIEPASDTIFKRYSELLNVETRFHQNREIACNEGSRFSILWSGMPAGRRRSILDDALDDAFMVNLGRGVDGVKGTLADGVLVKGSFSDGVDPTDKLDIIPYLFAGIDIDALSSSPAEFLQLVHARCLNTPNAYLRPDYERIVHPTLRKFNKLHRDIPLAGVDNDIKKKKKDMVVIADQQNTGTVVLGDIVRCSDWHAKYQMETWAKTALHVEDARWVYQFQLVLLDFIYNVLRSVLGIRSRSTVVEGRERGEVNHVYLQETLQNLLTGLPPTTKAASPLLDVLRVDYHPAFEKYEAMDIALASYRYATDRVYLLMSSPSYLLSSVRSRLDFRFEHITGEQLYSKQSVSDCITQTIWKSYARASLWCKITMLLEEIVEEGLRDIEDDSRYAGVALLLEELLLLEEKDVKRYFMCGPNLREYFYRAEDCDEEEGGSKVKWGHKADPADLYPHDPVAALLMLFSKLFETDREFSWVGRVFDLRGIVTEIEILLSKSPGLKDGIPGFTREFLNEVTTVLRILDILCFHIPHVYPDDRFVPAMFARKLLSQIRELQSYLSNVDMTAILRDGDALVNLQKYIMKEEGEEDVENYKKFWKLYNMKLKRECGYTLEYWYLKCGYDVLFAESRGFWHGRDGGCWKGETLEIYVPSEKEVNTSHPAVLNLGYDSLYALNRITHEEAVIEDQLGSYMAADYDAETDAGDYDVRKCWPGKHLDAETGEVGKNAAEVVTKFTSETGGEHGFEMSREVCACEDVNADWAGEEGTSKVENHKPSGIGTENGQRSECENEEDFWGSLGEVSGRQQNILNGMDNYDGDFTPDAQHVPIETHDESVVTPYLLSHPQPPQESASVSDPDFTPQIDNILLRLRHNYTDPVDPQLVFVSEDGYEILQSLSRNQYVPWNDFTATMSELGFKSERCCVAGGRWILRPEMGVDEAFMVDEWGEDGAVGLWRRLRAAYGFEMNRFWVKDWDAELGIFD